MHVSKVQRLMRADWVVKVFDPKRQTSVSIESFAKLLDGPLDLPDLRDDELKSIFSRCPTAQVR